jgi:hypothetical protein
MKIDNYITHLVLRRKGLNEKLTLLLMSSDKVKVKKNTKDPNYYEITNLRKEMFEINNKIGFYKNLRKAMSENEM